MKINLRDAALIALVFVGLGAAIVTLDWRMIIVSLLGGLGFVESRSRDKLVDEPEPDVPEPKTNISETIDEADQKVEDIPQSELGDKVDEAMEDL